MRPGNDTPRFQPRGFLLILLGVGLLAREFGWIPEGVRFVDFWPLLVIGAGSAGLMHNRGVIRTMLSLVVITFGGLLLAGNLGLLAFPSSKLWPVLLVLAGLSFAFGGRQHRKRYGGPPFGPFGGGPEGRHPRFGQQAQTAVSDTSPGASTTEGPNTGDVMNIPRSFSVNDNEMHQSLLFSGAQYKIESQAFRGGTLNVTGGGAELDLRYARLAPEGATLDVRVLAGGIDLRVPDTWHVVCEVTPTLGAADDTTRSTQGNADAPRFRVTGTVLMGGIEIRN